MIAKLRKIIDELQEEIERELEQRRLEFRYKLDQRRVVFEQGVLAQHRLLRMKVTRFIRESDLFYILTAPIIYSLIIPFVLMDVMVTLYQHICFRIYGIPLVRRSEYVVMDRKYLAYLNWIEKLNCMYCEYGNGLIAYVREVAARTEQFWCPIKHARKVKGAHERYYNFIEYGDAVDVHRKMEDQREKCRACEMPCDTVDKG